MTANRCAATATFIAALALAATARAQPETLTPVEETDASEALDDAAADQIAEPAQTEPELSEDEMADLLNSQQQLQQTFTLKRTINGEVVETEQRTVKFSRDEPYRETEAGMTTRERLIAAFDGEVLTRTEAFEEAKLDFTLADADRDGFMTAAEFSALVDSWRENDARQADAPDEETARQRQYEAFLAEINPEAAESQSEAYAREKFAFMAGAAEKISREDYLREYLLDFDSMDADKDTLLKDEELLRFRALNRGETIEM